MSAAEWAAFLLSLAYVVLNARQNIWCWPVGAASVAVYAWVFYSSHLYADGSLQLIYLGFSIYGWVSWRKLHGADAKPINKLNGKQAFIYLAATSAMFAVLYYLLLNITSASMPFWDALTASISLAATYLSARKYMENWALWIVANSIYIGLYWQKGLVLTAVLSLLMALLSVYGWWQWRRINPSR